MNRVTLLCIVSVCTFWAGTSLAEVHVIATTPNLADITQHIVGKYVHAESIMRGPENTHNVRPKPSYMMKLRKAKLFITSGLDGEPWAALLAKGARKPDLLPGHLGNVDVSKGIKLKEVPKPGQLSRALGDIHAFGNPHYMLDPLNALIAGRTILNALKRVDPSHADDYTKNFDAYAKQIRETTDRLKKKLEPYTGAKVVTYHRSWPYFLDRFGLVTIGEVEPKPGIAPAPHHLMETVERMNDANAKIVIVETYNSKKNADFVADKVGGKAVILPQEVHAMPASDSYLHMLEYNVDTLVTALQELGIKPNAPKKASTDHETQATPG